MRFLIQRVLSADVSVNQQIIGKINKGFLVFIGITDSDTVESADKLVKKLLHLRIFEDENGKTNLALEDVLGELLIISQFTLYADCRKGNRPSFTKAAAPDYANTLYEYIIAECRKEIPNVQHGEFGAEMKVQLVNDGPFTVILDSCEL